MLSIKTRFICAILLFLSTATVFAQRDMPVMQAGHVTISGQVFIPDSLKQDSVWLLVTIPQPFTGGNKRFKVLLDANGGFELKINTETNFSRFALGTDINPMHLINIPIRNGEDSKIAFRYNGDGDIDKVKIVPLRHGGDSKLNFNSSEDGLINNVKINDNPGMTEEDMLRSLPKLSEMFRYRSNNPREQLYKQPVSAYIDHANKILEDRRKLILETTPNLTKQTKEIIFRDFAMNMYETHVFDYHASMVLNYMNTNDHAQPDSAAIQKIDRRYFSFLKDLDLNNPLNLYCYGFPIFTKELLLNSTLNIPRINDTPIPEWTKNVKAILADLIGTDKGLFYEMLIGNAYALQLETELKPLTPRQMENITSYFKGNELETILLRRNQETVRESKTKETLIVNTTPDVSPEELMRTIIAKYKGKAVVVDFWATWCAPCLEAMQTSKALKKELAGKDAVFIYISGPSSPRKLWESHIQGIGGQQYYLNTEQYYYLQEHYDFSGIPAYLVFDKAGKLQKQFTGYPGNVEMQKLIETLL